MLLFELSLLLLSSRSLSFFVVDELNLIVMPAVCDEFGRQMCTTHAVVLAANKIEISVTRPVMGRKQPQMKYD